MELAKSNQYVPLTGFSVGADVEPNKSVRFTFALKINALLAMPRNE